MYNIGIVLYAFAIRLASLFHKKARLMVKGQHATWEILKSAIRQDYKYIWIHASSLGEFEQGRPLIEIIKRDYPQYKILLTFFSPSGYEVRKDYPLADVICYLPFDTRYNVNRFFKLVKPQKALFIKYEFWPNYFRQMKKNRIELYSVSSIFRKDQIFFKPYFYGKVARRILHRVTGFFVQDENSKKLLESINIKDNVWIAGDTRFDRVKEIMERSKPLPLIEHYVQQSQKSNRLMIVAGSTWSKDEEYLIEYFNTHEEVSMIIAPHEIDEEHLQEIAGRVKRPFALYSQIERGDNIQADCLIIDCFGILSSIYRYAQVAYIGGGFGSGIHNIIEAAVYGIPVIWGPNYKKFREARALIASGGGHSIENFEQLDALLNSYRSNPVILREDGDKSSAYVDANLGAARKIIDALNL